MARGEGVDNIWGGVAKSALFAVHQRHIPPPHDVAACERAHVEVLTHEMKKVCVAKAYFFALLVIECCLPFKRFY